jgi:hypothetical protein
MGKNQKESRKKEKIFYFLFSLISLKNWDKLFKKINMTYDKEQKHVYL